MSSLARRVLAKTFSSPEALEEYLTEHPQADRSKHKVDNKVKPQKPDDKAPPKAPPPSGPGTKAPKLPEKPAPKDKDKSKSKEKPKEQSKPRVFDGWKKTLRGLSDSAAKFVESSPKAIKSFLGDPDFRKHALGEAQTAVVKAPKKMVKNLIDTAKEEVHEYKTAAQGVNAMLHGKKMTKHQRHAFKTVATHMAIGATAASFAASGPLMGAAVFGKNLATHVAAKSVARALGNIHTLNEVGHVAHGVAHLLSHIASDEEIDPDQAIANLVLASVAKEITALEDEDLTQVLNEMHGDKDQKRSDKTAAMVVLWRFG